MKIFALRDRLIDYFMPPFVAGDDKEVMAMLARVVNGTETVPVATAPHQFELWRLGEIDDRGHVTASRTYICDAAALVRPKPAGGTGEEKRPLNGAGETPTVSPGPAESRPTQVL